MTKGRLREYSIWAILIFVFVIMHVYRIGDLPYAINCDEMGMGYDAWCLANFGTDRYQNSFPIYLINFSGGQSALYAYLCAPFVYFFGMNATVFRIPVVICSFITGYFLIKIITVLFGNKHSKIRVLAMFLYTIFPVFTMLFRIGLDCNLMLAFSTMFLYFLIKAVREQTIKGFVFAGILGGVVLYTYVLSHFVMPFFLIMAMAYLFYTKKINIKQVLALGIPIFILAIPLILFHIINMFELPELEIGLFTIPRLYRYRSDDMSWSGIWENMKRFADFTLIYDGVKYNSIEKFGTVYRLSIPFLVIGLIKYIVDFMKTIKHREFSGKTFILFWFIAMFCMGVLLGESGPIVYRMNAIYVVYLLFCIEGIVFLYYVIKAKWRKVANVFAGVVIVSYVILFISFAKYYFCNYTDDTYLLDWFNFKLDEPLEYLDSLPENISNRVTYIGDMNFTYIFYLGSEELPPQEYNELVDDKPYTLWLWTESYKNYRFNFPEEIDPLGNYVVPETSKKYIELYEEYGLEGTHVGKYYIFTNPWLDYSGENSDNIISWDHGVDEEGRIILDGEETTVLSGWALNSEYGKAWDDVVVDVDGTYYLAEKMEREDVASMVGNEALLDCGFHVTLDSVLVQNTKKIRVIFINYTDETCYVQEIDVE